MGEPTSLPIAIPGARPSIADTLARGTGRLLTDMGYRSLAEFSLSSGRRPDLIGLDRRGAVVIVEIKASVPDFRADDKWRHYLAWCDRFYFAVAEGFPLDLLPSDEGQIIADGYGGAILRPASVRPLAPARRRALTLAFARAAAGRLAQITDGTAYDAASEW
jgi:hypothetical protein